jgi:hypothetical protein
MLVQPRRELVEPMAIDSSPCRPRRGRQGPSYPSGRANRNTMQTPLPQRQHNPGSGWKILEPHVTVIPSFPKFSPNLKQLRDSTLQIHPFPEVMSILCIYDQCTLYSFSMFVKVWILVV